jgi:hypothetical protein
VSRPKTRAPQSETLIADQRKHTRFDVDASTKVSVLGCGDVHKGQIADLSQRGLRIYLPVSFPAGEILRVEAGEEVFVAVVCHCSKTLGGGFTLGVEMMHSIKRTHLDALVREWQVD